ncbi:uncharacterized protein B0H18DRAFT_1085031 [Fomitopsis serialis]|uniref:uncharacterized protein n=1 Tax=Fomitopsis serialis TaxID=139415 RepID=UPI002008DECF|nr:uncharacterized protein B0H18DRAFT_1085031 [Neoantrodia serialis]KAH9926451.1 hypothetical protein B0H18DRAFT_1085031 [Neoantrodia serialis]
MQAQLSEYPTSAPFEIGEVHVSRICIYPIKSCRGTSVTEVRYTPECLEDLTARQVPKMVLITPRIVPDPASASGGILEVSFPEESGCETFAVPLNPTQDILNTWETIDDGSVNGDARVDGYICQSVSSDPSPSSILSEYFERPVHLMMKGPAPRACPTTSAEESIAEFERVVRKLATDSGTAIGGLNRERWTKGSVLIDRFRANVIVKGAGVPFAEDFWREVVINPPPNESDRGRQSTAVTFVQKCTRCLLPNVDPNVGDRDAAVPFKILMKFRTGMYHEGKNKPCFGTYGVFNDSGVIKMGDTISVTEWTDADGV